MDLFVGAVKAAVRGQRFSIGVLDGCEIENESEASNVHVVYGQLAYPMCLPRDTRAPRSPSFSHG